MSAMYMNTRLANLSQPGENGESEEGKGRSTPRAIRSLPMALHSMASLETPPRLPDAGPG